jgi:hypothetical protein
MILNHTFNKGDKSLTIQVEYSHAERVVTEVIHVWATDGGHHIDILHILGEYFNLDEVVDGINWPEVAAEAEDDMQVPCEDDDEEGWRD